MKKRAEWVEACLELLSLLYGTQRYHQRCDDEAARQQAERIAGELAEPKAGQEDSSWQGWSIRVVDEAGREVVSLPVRLK